MLLSNEDPHRLGNMHGHVFWQVLRFGISGLALTALVSAVYYFQVTYTSIAPAIALTLATVGASVIGYFVHANFSFRAHGMRDNPSRRFVRFLVTNGLGYLLNLAFVFALIDLMGLPEWTPVIGFCLVTPMVSFLLNRHWVFK
jgi:putative flippase GtrA